MNHISILMPFKNAAPWLQETIVSIMEQTFVDWELIAVDDHSLDNGVALIRAFDDPRIHVVSNEGEGIIPALQTGLNLARGTFVSRMDGDDRMPVDKLQRLYDLVSHTTERVVGTGKVRYFSEGPVSEGYREYEAWLNERIDRGDHFNHIYRECVVASPNWIVRREHLIQDRIFNDLHYPEDYDMVFRWQHKGYRIVCAREITHLWREHPERTSRNSDVYDQASFFQLKLHWFRINFPDIKTLAVFGANAKGKQVVDALREQYQLSWYDVDYLSYGAGIAGFAIQDPNTCTEPYALIAVYPREKEALEDFLHQKNLVVGSNAWYV